MTEGAKSRARKYLERARHFLKLDILPPMLRRIIVAMVGGTIVLIGVALIVLPGPASLVIPLGLVVLGTEFAWARRVVRKAQAVLAKAKDTVTRKSPPTGRE
jgi:tellurite resistance protein TerC